MKFPVKLLAVFSLIVTITIPILYLGWKKFLKAEPPTLPAQAAFADNKNPLLPGSYYEVSIPPTKDDKYLSADYRIWIPDGVQKVRGLIVKQHGCGGAAAATGLDHANDLQWQALALKHQLALVGTKISSGDLPCENWALINHGSESAFLKAIAAFSEKSQHSELKDVPWVLWGHSGGADWVAQMLQQYPERTIAAIAARGGGFTMFGTNPTLVEIPVLFALGEKDKEVVYETHELPKQAFFRYRKIDAPWALAFEANTGHETGDTRLLSIPYFDAILTSRLSKDGNDLRPIDKAKGWLGDTSTREIAPANQYRGDRLKAAWFPNEETARKWQEYVSKGQVSPITKPDAPTDVSATKISPTEVAITWKFTPDLENGLPSFRIYRNNSVIQTLQGQSHNFGDAPKPANIFLEFKDTNASADSVYSVAAFNELGESLSQPSR
jgi:pimeloyl-ACP methyl ester carboxylesterase